MKTLPAYRLHDVRLLVLLVVLAWTCRATSASSNNLVPPPTTTTTTTPLQQQKQPIIPHYQYDFHKDPPLVPGPQATLAELEANATDDFILRIVDQVALPHQAFGRYNANVILRYNPHRTWLWRRWHGTILQSSVHKVLWNMLLSGIVCVVLRQVCGGASLWRWGLEPSGEECLWVARLKVFDKLWHYQQTLTTFILTFFLGQAYSLWRDMYQTARIIQGRLNDVGMLLATHATRHQDTDDAGGSRSSRGVTETSQIFLTTVARQLRLYHIMVWASQARQFKVLLTNRGLQFMMQRGFLTPEELEVLWQLPLAATQRHNAVLEWIFVGIQDAQTQGILHDTGSYQKLLWQKLCELRGTCAGIGDILDGRMPLAYAHFVQFLVDSFLFAAPLALYAELGVFSILCVAMLTLFYEGLLDLSKIFLDPLNNEDYCEGGIDMDLGVFIRESNAGSTRWMDGLSAMPAVATGARSTSSSGNAPPATATPKPTLDGSVPKKPHDD